MLQKCSQATYVGNFSIEWRFPYFYVKLILLTGPDTKSFPADKNYILKQAQLDLKRCLIRSTVDSVIHFYERQSNPLGLIDPTISQLRGYRFKDHHILDEFYAETAAIYRYLNADNQLEFLFDGTTHYEKFCEGWSQDYAEWVQKFCVSSKSFVRAVLEASVFYEDSLGRRDMISSRLRNFLHRYFGLKMYVYHGVREVGVA